MPIPTRPRHALAALLLGASLALAGCSGTGDSGTKEARADQAAAPEAQRGAQGPASGYGGGAKAAKPGAVRQHVIRTTTLSVEVEDAERALGRAREIAADAGGHVADESTRRHRDGDLTSQVSLRVPQAAYEDVIKELTGTGKLLSRRAEAQDVTEQVVDVESRIATQRASVARVRELMGKAEQLSDIVQLEQELSTRQANLESLLAQQASLKDRTSLATVKLELSEPDSDIARDDDEPGVMDALRGGWEALLTSLTWFVLVLAALAPWLGLLGAGFLVWRRVVAPVRARRRARRPQPQAPAPWPPRTAAPRMGAPVGGGAPVPPQGQAGPAQGQARQAGPAQGKAPEAPQAPSAPEEGRD
ncbi:DUF4349 domain-containing protein [Streptomyces thermolilacinus]|uniref:DUF4349 domain-containing protein n=1 Tax=Streptomyces thermolilacinus SPC6 TaxID=1306406 RepID=A0A1D3DND8_9ACTN|nr:DUF4349 domain-containing protein [Streptomyces thermolilacinus]OEJ93847.1 hypothetical protein J116_004560 [Streptomyces thermolilacinus SPC6]